MEDNPVANSKVTSSPSGSDVTSGAEVAVGGMEVAAGGAEVAAGADVAAAGADVTAAGAEVVAGAVVAPPPQAASTIRPVTNKLTARVIRR
jgi:hypothetical protein